MKAMADSIGISTRDKPEAHKMGDESLRILVFSHKPGVRESIVNAIGRKPATDLAKVTFVEVSGIADVLSEMDAGTVDLAILDGEAQPTGGIGLTRQLKNEITDCPPIVVAVRRKDDRWLATWSQADAVLVHPLDPLTAAETVAGVLRARRVPAVPTNG
ncbi:MAG: signal transduction protein [Amycolatopsis sp.]|jgi:DNA-binding response OmpR family regulator|nr:signal transduction protein [Amycolatopsis sp.]